MHVLVAGCGWLGKAVGGALVARGDHATGVRRTDAAAAELTARGITALALDLADPFSASAIPGDVEAIVACQAAGTDTVEAYEAAYLRVNRTLLEAARRLGVKRFVYTGSTGVFGQRDGSDVDETTPPATARPPARVLVEAEELVLDAARDVPARVVRLSGLYGPGRTWLVDSVRKGSLALGPGDDAWMSFCHLDDAVAAVLAALDRGRPGAIYHATDAFPTRRRDVIQWIAARLGLPPPHSDAGVAESHPNRRILGERTREELGLTLRYPSFREGVEALLAPGASRSIHA